MFHDIYSLRSQVGRHTSHPGVDKFVNARLVTKTFPRCKTKLLSGAGRRAAIAPLSGRVLKEGAGTWRKSTTKLKD